MNPVSGTPSLGAPPPERVALWEPIWDDVWLRVRKRLVSGLEDIIEDGLEIGVWQRVARALKHQIIDPVEGAP